MSTDLVRRAESLFREALEIAASERLAFVDARCAGDRALAEEVASLLHHHDAAGEFLEKPIWVEPTEPGATRLSPSTPERIGRYVIERVLGAGGMGIVYVALQESPRRIVALKLLRFGFAGPGAEQRFRREAQLLGRLRHPGIAQIFEASTADAGFGPQPYFAMEYVPGCTLDEWARRRALPLRGRLELLVEIAEAVQHAHEQGVLHRDLKPSNVLVDESGRPKVIDFGVARALDAEEGSAAPSLLTDTGQLVGTISYMSPEQAGGDVLDARSDVYALGVIGYELLVGRLPYDVANRPAAEAARILKEEEPVPLSIVDRSLRGDLETIFSKALEKERTRRYPSARVFADDLRRHLRDEPIQARAPSTFYQLGKLARRHRGLVVGAAVAFGVLLGGVATTSWQWRLAVSERNRAKGAEDLAESRLADLARSHEEVLAEVGRAHAIVEFLRDLITSVDPGRDGRDVRVHEILARASTRLPGAVAGQPTVEAALHEAIGSAYRGLGLLAEAEAHARESLELRQASLGPDAVETLDSEHALASIRRRQGAFEDAERRYRAALDGYVKRLGPEHRKTLSVRSDLASVLQERGDLAGAEAALVSVLADQRRLFGPDDPAPLTTLNNLAILLERQGRSREAEALFDEASARLSRTSGEADPRTLQALSNHAESLRTSGRRDEAESLLRRVLDVQKRVLGEDHPDVLVTENNLAVLLLVAGRVGEVIPLFEAIAAAQARSLGESHPELLATRNNLAEALRQAGRAKEAVPQFESVLAAREKATSADDPTTLHARHNLGLALLEANEPARAVEHLEAVLSARRRVLGANDPKTLDTLNALAGALQSSNRLAEAESLYRQAIDASIAASGEQSHGTLVARYNLGRLLTIAGRLDEAHDLLVASVAGAKTLFPSGHWMTAAFRGGLGECLERQDRFEEAERELLSAHAAMESAFGAANLRTQSLVDRLVRLYERWNRADDAASWRARQSGERR